MRKAPAGLLAQVPAEHGCSAAEVILSAGMFMASGRLTRHLEVGRTFWEISGFAGSIVALIGIIGAYHIMHAAKPLDMVVSRSSQRSGITSG